MTQLTDNIFAYSLPNGNYGEGLIIEVDGKHYLNLIDDNGEMLAGTKPLPPGSYRFLFTTATAIEEDARKVVESEELFINGNSQGIYYCNYLVPHDVCEWYKHWLNSLRSLLQSKGLDPKNNYALIEKM